MLDLFKIVVAFVLTGVVGNRILQAFQYSSWRRQQKFLGQEKEYNQLRELSSQISEIAGKRIYAMRQAGWSLRSTSSEDLDSSLDRYKIVLTEWNEKLGTFTSQLTFYAAYEYALRLENDIHAAFQRTGTEIELLARKRRAGDMPSFSEINLIGRALNQIQALLFSFNRDVVRLLEERRKRIYFGEELSYTPGSLRQLSTPELLKALFISDVDSHSIIRPAADPGLPGRSGD